MQVETIYTRAIDFYTEGPAIDAAGNVYCTTLTGGSILRIDPAGDLSVWASGSCPNGHIILANGGHLVCDSREATIKRYSPDGLFKSNEMSGTCNGTTVFVPNDLVADDRGGVYFTDSIRNDGKVCYLNQDGREEVLASGLDYPNGLVLSPDRCRLFVAESYMNRVLSIPLTPAGLAAAPPAVHCKLPAHTSGREEANLPDGMALDHKNRLWVAHYGMQALQVLSIKGELLHSIPTPFPLVSNVYISGADPAVIIVTGGWGEPGPGVLMKLLIRE